MILRGAEIYPAERAPREAVERQCALFNSFGLLQQIIDACPYVMLVMNVRRQIVMLNRALLWLTPGKTAADVLGQRIGEALDCVHAREAPDGCGSAEFCRNCGSLKAILLAVAAGPDNQECRITRFVDERQDSLECMFSAAPVMAGDERYVFCTLVDASHEKRRRVLERVFFHDLLSELCVLELLGDSLTQAPPEELSDCARQIAACCRRLGGIVGIHRDLVAAEAGKLSIDQTRVETDSFLSDLADQYRPLLTQKCKLVATSDPVVISTDVGLLSRVLGNMIRNAVEASLPGEVIALACREQGAEVEFTVHNAAVMPREVQLRVFQRSFSTKGPARGLGTYGMKLITERYLGGRVWFQSSEGEGTTFFASFPKILPF